MSVISAEVAKRLNTQVDERQAQMGSGQKRFERGVHILQLNDVKAEEVKKGNNEGMDQLTLIWADPEGVCADVKQVFTYGDDSKAWAVVGQQRMVEVLKRGFGTPIAAAKNVEEVANQFRKFKGHKVQAAIYDKQNIWRVIDKKTNAPALRKDGHPDVRLTHFPEVRYVGPIDEDLYFDAAKAEVELNAKDALEWNAYKEKYGEKSGDTPVAATNGATDAGDGEDLVFDNDQPSQPAAAKVATPAPKAAAKTPEAKEEPKDAVDEMTFE